MENKRTRGRQKISIRKIENRDDMYASFSKRRAGLYKKASELCTLCNIDIAIIIFSPTGKPFSFFHPNMDSIISKFLNPNEKPSESSQLVESYTRTKINKLNQKLDELSAQMEAENERANQFDQPIEENKIEGWWKKPIQELNKQEVDVLTSWFKNLQIEILKRMDQLKNEVSSSSSFPIANFRDVPYPNHTETAKFNIVSSASSCPPQNVPNVPYAYANGTTKTDFASSSSAFPFANAPNGLASASMNIPYTYGFGTTYKPYAYTNETTESMMNLSSPTFPQDVTNMADDDDMIFGGAIEANFAHQSNGHWSNFLNDTNF